MRLKGVVSHPGRNGERGRWEDQGQDQGTGSGGEMCTGRLGGVWGSLVSAVPHPLLVSQSLTVLVRVAASQGNGCGLGCTREDEPKAQELFGKDPYAQG